MINPLLDWQSPKDSNKVGFQTILYVYVYVYIYNIYIYLLVITKHSVINQPLLYGFTQ